MSTVSWVLPGNTHHSNHQSARMAAMDDERYGLPVLRKYGMPATVFFQGVDLRMKPWLREEMAQAGSVEWGNATFSHTLIPLYPRSWESEMRERLGSVPVTFFAEFYVPASKHVPTQFTLVLAGHSSLYSAFMERPDSSDIDVDEYPEGAHSIRFGETVGILMREEWYSALLGAFFRFQRFPLKGSDPDGKDRLAELVAEIRKIADDGQDRVVVTPLDLEAPWVGSHFGASIWEMLLAEVERQGLMHVFTPLSKHLERFDREAVKTRHPHRELSKWTSFQMQHDHASKIRAIRPRSERQVILKMIASGSDIFSAWNSKIRGQKRSTVLTAVHPTGEYRSIQVGFNQSVIDVQLAAFEALRSGEDGSFLEHLQAIAHRDGTRKDPDYFVRLAIEMARREGW